MWVLCIYSIFILFLCKRKEPCNVKYCHNLGNKVPPLYSILELAFKYWIHNHLYLTKSKQKLFQLALSIQPTSFTLSSPGSNCCCVLKIPRKEEGRKKDRKTQRWALLLLMTLALLATFLSGWPFSHYRNDANVFSQWSIMFYLTSAELFLTRVKFNIVRYHHPLARSWSHTANLFLCQVK